MYKILNLKKIYIYIKFKRVNLTYSFIDVVPRNLIMLLHWLIKLVVKQLNLIEKPIVQYLQNYINLFFHNLNIY